MIEGINFEEFCYNHGIYISLQSELSTLIRGFCYYDSFFYHIILNEKLDSLQLKETTIHEIIHVLSNHFSCSINDAWECEREVKDMITVMEMVFI